MHPTRWFALTLALAGLMLMPALSADQDGISGVAVDNGCVCHASAESGDTTVTVTGVPTTYEASTTYTLTLSVSGPDPTGDEADGGFNLRASKGTLAVPTDALDVQIEDEQATHTEGGNDQRRWQIDWTSPADTNSRTTFTAYGNAVNGDGELSNADHWNVFTTTVEGATYVEEDSPGFTIGFGLAAVAVLAVLAIAAKRRRE